MDFKRIVRLDFISKKIVRRIVRMVLALLGLYLLLLIGLSLYISSSRERLINFLNANLKETILGEFKINKADITVWQTFPRLKISLEDVSISDSFYHKPFLKAGYISAKVGFLGLMGNKLTISSVNVENAVIHIFTDAKGYTNSYVLMSKNKANPKSKKPVVLSNLKLENVTVVIEDAIKNKRYQLRFDNADIDMRLTGSKYHITMDEDMLVGGLGFNLSKGYWLQNQRLQARWKLEYDTSGKILTVNKTQVKIQDHPFTVSGAFFLNAPAHFHIDADTKKIPYSAAMVILKPTTREKIKKLNLSGPVDATLLLDGPMAYKSIPLVKLNFKTENNNINTPVLNLNKCSFSGSFINQVDVNLPRTDNNSRIIINSFVSSWGEINLKADHITVTNLLKPVIQFEFFSQCTLPQLDEQLSSSNLHFTNGNAKLYLAYNGPLIADPSLLNQLNAKIQIQNGTIAYVPHNLNFSACNGAIEIVNNNLSMKDFQCNLNTNHFVVNIAGDSINKISNNEPGNTTINCSIYTPALNLADFKSLFGKRTKTAKKKTKSIVRTMDVIDNALESGNVFINLKAQQLSLKNFKASNVAANLLFARDDWQIQKAYLQHADGNFNLTANIHPLSEALQRADIQINLQHINIKKLFYGFDNFGQTSLTYNNINGVLDSKVNVTANINSTGRFVPSTMNGKIFFSLKNAQLINFQPLLNIQKFVFKNRNLNNVQFANITDTFDIQNGDFYIHRLPIQSTALTMYIEGVYSFEDRTDLSIQVPFATLTSNPGDYNDIKKKKNSKPGSSLYLRAQDKNGQMKIGLDLFKKLRKNKSIKTRN